MRPKDSDELADSGTVDVVVERITPAPEVTEDSSTAVDDVEVDSGAKSGDDVLDGREAGTSLIVVAAADSGIVVAKGSSRPFTEVVVALSVTRSDGVMFWAKDIKDSTSTRIRR
jgi:hypothetical protein